jgi:hypothetical protein
MSAVFLFGAGASFGSDTQNTPPLGADLFKALASFDPNGWGALPASLQSLLDEDFERGMRSLPPHDMAPLQRKMASFFYTFSPSRNNLYVNLSKRIRDNKWRGALCTLNYDRLLEQSLLHAGIQPFVGDRPAHPHIVELCLPHGCCHIFCDSVSASAGGVTFDALNVKLDGPVSVVADAKAHLHRLQTDAFPPVMSYFEPDKRTTAGVSFIAGQRARWDSLARNASKIIIVGVRIREHDKHIWEPITASAATVIYCGGPDDINDFNNSSIAQRGASNAVRLDTFFRGAFETLCSEAGL